MMKKLVLAALALCALVPPAFAQNNFAARKVWETVAVRTYAAANPAPGYIDSTAWSAVGVEAATSAVLDTTIAFSMDNWVPQSGAPGTSDSTNFATLIIHDSRGNSSDAGTDSIRVVVQVSGDGNSWASCQSFKDGTGTGTFSLASNNQTIITGLARDQLSTTGAGNSPKIWVYKFRNAAANSLAFADMFDIGAFRYVRFIFAYIEPSGYKLSAELGHYEVGN